MPLGIIHVVIGLDGGVDGGAGLNGADYGAGSGGRYGGDDPTGGRIRIGSTGG